MIFFQGLSIKGVTHNYMDVVLISDEEDKT